MWLATLLGAVGAILGSITTGIIEFIIFRKTIKENRNKFSLEIEDAHKRFNKEVEVSRENQKDIIKEHFKNIANPDNEDFICGLKKEIVACSRLLNELNYLNNLTSNMRKCTDSNIYPLITNRIEQIIDDVEIPPSFAVNVGALRCHIDIYNSLCRNAGNIGEIENELNKIRLLINTVNEERFNTYMQAKSDLRHFCQEQSKEVVDNYNNIDKKLKLWEE